MNNIANHTTKKEADSERRTYLAGQTWGTRRKTFRKILKRSRGYVLFEEYDLIFGDKGPTSKRETTLESFSAWKLHHGAFLKK